MTAPDATTRLQDLPMELPPLLPTTARDSLAAKNRPLTIGELQGDVPEPTPLFAGGPKESPRVLLVDDGTLGRGQAKQLVAALAKADVATEIVATEAEAVQRLSDAEATTFNQFIEAIDVAVQLGMRLETRLTSKPAPIQLQEWLEDTNTPPSYMQVVMEALMPGSTREATDLQSRLTDAKRLIDIQAPDFDLDAENLTEGQQQHVRLWRLQEKQRSDQRHKFRTIMSTVMGLTAGDPFMQHMASLVPGRVRSGFAGNALQSKAKSPEQLAAERARDKSIQLHNHAVDQKARAKAERKAAKKAERRK